MNHPVRSVRRVPDPMSRHPPTAARPPASAPLILAACLAALLAGCAAIEQLPELFSDHQTPRERYLARLEYAGVMSTALGRDWLDAADRALAEAPLVSAPHAEDGYLPAAEPAAIAFRVQARRGQEIAFEFRLPGDSTTQVFLEVWEVSGDSLQPLRYLEAADSGSRSLLLEPRHDGEYLFRAQPELLRGGRFNATLRIGPTLAFPVLNGREHDIGSNWGDPRDGGRRDHHGIDIFARRGTPVLAAASATVRRVETTPRGGNVVWLRDERGNSLYYAHLDRQAVSAGMRVAPGDTVGFVGNTGNARTTPPHLHFGVYRRGEGPVNPTWFVYRPGGRVPALVADTALLGTWARTPHEQVVLRGAPREQGAARRELGRHTPLRVLAAVGDWFRVRLPDGATGYVAARAVEVAGSAVESAALAVASPLLTRPDGVADPGAVRALLGPGETVDVLGRFAGYLFVRTGQGASGWVSGADPVGSVTTAQ